MRRLGASCLFRHSPPAARRAPGTGLIDKTPCGDEKSRARWSFSPRCEVFRTVYREAEAGAYTSWKQVERSFLASMSSFDTSIGLTIGAQLADNEKWNSTAAPPERQRSLLQRSARLLLRNWPGSRSVQVAAAFRTPCRARAQPRRRLSVHVRDRIKLEAKMMGTPKHIDSPKQRSPAWARRLWTSV